MSEKSLDWTDIYLKINVSEFVNQVDMRCEEKRDNEDDSYPVRSKIWPHNSVLFSTKCLKAKSDHGLLALL